MNVAASHKKAAYLNCMNIVPIRIIVVLLVIFFLTFLGMRLSFLEKSSKPKPKPRAVLNLSVKSLSSVAGSLNSIPTFDMDVPQAAVNIDSIYSRLIYVTTFKNPLTSFLIDISQGRSPPVC